MAIANAALRVESGLHHTDALPAGTRLAEFELQTLLGFGGFGMVYRAYDHSLHRLVAIKEYMPTALAGRTGVAVSTRSSVDGEPFRAGLQSFMAEARLLAQFDHPSLVKVFRVWEQNGTAYIAMPFYRGMTLQQAQGQLRRPPSEAWLRTLLWPLLEALKVLHLHHMVHRDLSPDNIFLQDVGPPVLLDLGAARRAIGDRTQQHTAILKVHYAPIEQYAEVEDLRQGPWSDLYALAAVVHGCLRREPPLPATFRVLRDRLPPLASVTASLHAQFGLNYSPAFVEGLTRALAVEPGDRPQSAAAFAESLQLVAPVALEHFDWRAALGDAWQVAPAAPVVAASSLATRRIEPAPRPVAVAPVHVSVHAPVHAPVHPPATVQVPRTTAPPAAPGRVAVRRGRAAVFWGLVGTVGAGLLAAVVFVVQPAWAPEAVPAAAAPGVAAGPDLGAAADAADEHPAVVAEPAAAAGEGPDTAAADGTPLLRDSTRARPRPSARALSAEEICPDSNFLTRPMCLYRACQTARYVAMPVCIENARQLRDSRRPEGG